MSIQAYSTRRRLLKWYINLTAFSKKKKKTLWWGEDNTFFYLRRQRRFSPIRHYRYICVRVCEHQRLEWGEGRIFASLEDDDDVKTNQTHFYDLCDSISNYCLLPFCAKRQYIHPKKHVLLPLYYISVYMYNGTRQCFCRQKARHFSCYIISPQLKVICVEFVVCYTYMII